MIRWLLVAIVVSGTSCNVFDPRFDDFDCQTQADCTAPRTCVMGTCVLSANAPDADPNAPDADPNAPDADPNAPDADLNAPDARITADGNPGCNTAGTVGPTDNFEDGVATPTWTVLTTGLATAVEASGVVRLAPEANANVSTSATYNSAASFPIAEGRLFIEAVEATSGFTRFRYGTGGTYVEIDQRAGMISVLIKSGAGMPSELGSSSYDPSAHAWWQLREFGGTVFGEASSDGTNWTTIGSGPSPSFTLNPRATLSAGSGDAVPNPGAAQFDNFNRCP